MAFNEIAAGVALDFWPGPSPFAAAADLGLRGPFRFANGQDYVVLFPVDVPPASIGTVEGVEIKIWSTGDFGDFCLGRRVDPPYNVTLLPASQDHILYGTIPDPAATPMQTWSNVTPSQKVCAPYFYNPLNCCAAHQVLYVLHTSSEQQIDGNGNLVWQNVEVVVSRYDPVAGAWLTDIGALPIPAFPASATLPYVVPWVPDQVAPGTLISGRADGRLILFASVQTETITGTKYARAAHSIWDCNAWAAATSVPGQSGVANHFVPAGIVTDSTGISHLFYYVKDGDPFNLIGSLYYFNVNAAGVASAPQLLASDFGIPAANLPNIGLPMLYTEGGQEKIALPYSRHIFVTNPGQGFGLSVLLANAGTTTPTWVSEDAVTPVAGFVSIFLDSSHFARYGCHFSSGSLYLYYPDGGSSGPLGPAFRRVRRIAPGNWGESNAIYDQTGNNVRVLYSVPGPTDSMFTGCGGPTPPPVTGNCPCPPPDPVDV